MSSLWTPEGEHGSPSARRRGTREGSAVRRTSPPMSSARSSWPPRGRLEQLPLAGRRLVANHCYGLFELAAIHLSESPPHLSRPGWRSTGSARWSRASAAGWARPRPTLRGALAQIRLAFVEPSDKRPHTADGSDTRGGGPAG